MMFFFFEFKGSNLINIFNRKFYESIFFLNGNLLKNQMGL